MKPFSRRSFFKGAAATGAGLAAISVMSGCTHTSKTNEDAAPLEVDEKSGTSVTDSYAAVEPWLTEVANYTLPIGNVLFPAEGTWIPMLTAGESASPMVKGSALNSQTGETAVVVGTQKDTSPSVVIYDVRMSDEVYAWLELNMDTRVWSLYAQACKAGKLEGEATKLWDADANWEPAPFACSGKKVLWQVMPSTKGTKTREFSYAYIWTLGDTEATRAVESQGRFATRPSISGGLAILTPRVRVDEGTYYGATAYKMSDNLATKIDQLTLPVSVKPFRASRIDNKFMISIEASYQSGGLLGQMGTYFADSNGENVVFLNREPSELAAGKGSTVIVKNRASYLVCDMEGDKYSSLIAQDRSVDYGEYPAREGECDNFITFSTVKDANTGYPANVHVRVFNFA